MKARKVLFLILVLMMTVQVQGIIYVRKSGGDYDNFQAAVNAAVAAGGTQTIVVGDGTYKGAGNYNILVDTDGINLTIESENGLDSCIVDADGLGRVFDLRNVNLADSVTIAGFTIRGGIAPDTYGGGGIFNHNSVLTVENCYIIGNSSTKGGGIYTGGTVGSLIMTDCRIADNVCTSSSGGGAMHINNNTSVSVTGCDFVNNSVASPNMHAGGMYIAYCDVDFINCVFQGNSANGSGGVFYATSSTVDFINCTLAGNKCSANGGVGFITESVYTTTVNVENCIFRDNEAGNLGETFYIVANPAQDAVLNYTYCDIDSSSQSINGNGTWNDLGGNINVDPLFAEAGYWDTGSWVEGDYHLMSMVGRWDLDSGIWTVDAEHSPCIDAGDPADDFSNESNVPNGVNGGRINMGAYGNTAQASKSPYCLGVLSGDLNGDCHVNFYDFAEMVSQWLMCDMEPQSMCWQ